MSAHGTARERVVMFADIVGSTRLYETLGDQAANTLIRDCLRLLSAIVTTKHGTVITEIGDEIMCCFDSAQDAAGAACEMQAALLPQPESAAGNKEPIRIRIGLHCGRLHGNADDLIGETAKLAQWAAKNAKPDQILMTRRVFDGLPRIYKAVARFVDDETWNLASFEHLEIFELVWDVEAATAYKNEAPPARNSRYQCVVFTYDGHDIVLNDARPVVSVGRDVSNDLVITHDLVSRLHFRAQFSRGRCTITDNSTNGTHIVTADNERIPIRRETFPLQGTGRIFLGEPSEAKAKYAIKFSCR